MITQSYANLPHLWLSATEGDGSYKVDTLSHWPDQETVDNRTIDLKAKEEVWRDYYTGERLEDWSKPYYSSNEDKTYGEGYNCMEGFTRAPSWERSWFEFQCE